MKKILELLKRKQYAAAGAALQDYFFDTIVKKPAQIVSFIEANAALPKSKRLSFHELCSYRQDWCGKSARAFFTAAWRHLTPLINGSKKSVKALPHLAYDVDNKYFIALMKPFLSTANLRITMLGLHFSGTSIVATDAHLLLHLYGKTKYQGTYCITKKCFDVEKEVVAANYPNFESVMPSVQSLEGNYTRYTIDTHQWIKLLSWFANNGFHNDDKHVRVELRGKRKIVHIDAIKLLKALTAFAKLGHTETALHLQQYDRAILLTPAGVANPTIADLKTDIALIMPLWMDLGKEADLAKRDAPPFLPVFNLTKGLLHFSAKATEKTGISLETTSEADHQASASLKNAIAALSAAIDFAETKNKTTISAAIEALETALIFS